MNQSTGTETETEATEAATKAATESGEPPRGADVYAAFLREQLEAQDARKASFEQRGLAVVTTAGTLVTLLFALAAFTTNGRHPKLAGDAKTWLAVALVTFVVAAAVALATNLPLFYDGPKPERIKARIKDDQFASVGRAERDVALTRANMLPSWKRANTIKGWLLFAAMVLEVVAVACVGVSIFYVIDP